MIIYENEELLREVQTDMSVIPANTLTFSENALYVAEAVERDFNEMFETIGVNELAVFESTGMQIVYEGKTLKDFKDTVINFFKQAWAKIKAFFESALVKFQSFSKEVKKMIPEIKESDLEALPKDKTFGKTHEFEELNKSLMVLGSYGDNAIDYASKVSDQFEKLSKQDGLDSKQVAEKANELEKDICSKVSGIPNVDNSSEMTKAIGKKLLGEEIEADLEFVKKNLTTIRNIVVAGSPVKSIKESYKKSRKFIDDQIKTIKGYTDERIKVSNSEIKVIRSIMHCLTQANGKGLDVAKRQFNEYRNILVRVAVALGKEKKVANESTTTPYSAQLDLIEAAFNF